MKPANDRTVTLKITRGEACKLLVLLVMNYRQDQSWMEQLHEKIKKQIREFDAQQPDTPFLP